MSRPALVLDIDDTALTNWEVIDDFGRIIGGRCDALPEGPCGWAAWDLLGKAPFIEPCACSIKSTPNGLGIRLAVMMPSFEQLQPGDPFKRRQDTGERRPDQPLEQVEVHSEFAAYHWQHEH